MLYTFVAGLLLPLRTGILDCSPNNAQAGSLLTVQVTGYNAHYQQSGNSLNAWLKLDSLHWLAAQSILVQDNRHLAATFQLPFDLPGGGQSQAAKLVVSNQLDGTHELPNALFITPSPIDTIIASPTWDKGAPQGLWAETGTAFPYLNILEETIRNLFFHVPLWFAMMILLSISVINSIKYLKKSSIIYDYKAVAYAEVGVLFGLLGLATGALWAKHTWGAYWSFDVKQNMAAIAVLIYMAYFVLRGSFEDDEKRSKISAVYNIFAFSMLIPLLFVIPRLTDSLHPGNGGNPGFNSYDLDSTMRLVFYPAVLGFILLGVWMAQLLYRYLAVRDKALDV